MDNILFVNISDIHTSLRNKDCINKKLHSLIDVIEIQKCLKSKKHVVLLVSGDIAFSGKEEEYKQLEDTFDILKEKFHIILCPGNHDHNFSSYSEVTRDAMLSIPVNEIDDVAIKIASSGMMDYDKFEMKYSSFKPIKSTSLSKLYEIDISSEKFSILTLNTAWCSKLHERGGDIKFPISKIIDSDNVETKFVMFHHPLSWFEPNNSKEIRNFIRNNYSVILSGHEHINDSFKIDTESTTTLMIESLPIDDIHVENNGFMTFEIEGNDILISTYFWDGNTYNEYDNFLKSDVIELKKALVSNNFEVSKTFYNHLQDLGAEYIHPNIKKISLDNVFIYPNVRDLSDEKEQTRGISSNTILSNNIKHIIFIGDEFCGKTTILKKYFLDVIKKEQLALFLDGNVIKKSNKNITKILNDAVTSQFVGKSLNEFLTYKTQKTLLIDDFHDIKGDVNSLRNFLLSLEGIFDKIIITLSDSSKFSGVDIIEASPFTPDYKQYQLLKFGYRLRYELANKWNSLKDECAEEKTKLIHNNDSSSRMINTIIGKNYIPSTPFFLLTMLQSIDNERSTDLKTSSYGYYYQFLITSSLGNASVRKEQLDEIFNYITELSYYFHAKNIDEDSKDNLWNFNMKFCNEYGVQIDFSERFGLLKRAKIIESTDGEYYKFKYHYIFYFFIAKYFSDHLKDTEVIDEIRRLSSSLHLKESMNILMFLTHHSKDQLILDLITSQAKLLFHKFEPATIDFDTDFINSIVDNLPEVSFIKKDRLEFRRQVEDSKDENYQYDDVNDDESSIEDSSNPTDLSRQFNLTIKSLELLGQLSRNYYGSLKIAQKEFLLEEAINTPLRSLNFLLSSASNEPEKTIDALEIKLNEILSSKKNISQSDIREIARSILFRMIFTITYSIVSKIASSIGSVHLQPVIDKVCENKNSDAGKLIRLASMLEVGQSISIEELKRINYSLSKNNLSELLVKTLVLNYLYMFERPEKQVQQICAAINISYDAVSKEIGFQKLSK